MRKISLNLILLLATIISTNIYATSDDALVIKGEAVFISKCDYCHGRGLQKGGTMLLEQRYQGTVPATLQDRTDLHPIYIKTMVRIATKGMAPFRLTEISDAELDALIAYLVRNNP